MEGPFRISEHHQWHLSTVPPGPPAYTAPAEGEIMLQPVYFLSHGGGPWPWLEGPFRRDFDWLEASLKALPGQLPEPPRPCSRFPGIGKKRISPFPRRPAGDGL
jgi:hypothetical protein